MRDRSLQECSLKILHPRRATTPMSKPHPISSEHARAICAEIGDRLRFALRDDYADLPPRLRELVSRLAELDYEAPSLVPSLEDMMVPLHEAA